MSGEGYHLMCYLLEAASLCLAARHQPSLGLSHYIIIHCSHPLDLTILTAPPFCYNWLLWSFGAILNRIFSQSDLFSIGSFLNLVFSQSGLFSILSFLNLVFSQSGLFSIESFWGRHRQLDDSLVGQLTKCFQVTEFVSKSACFIKCPFE